MLRESTQFVKKERILLIKNKSCTISNLGTVSAFENSIVIKKSDPSDSVEFHKIWYNSAEF
jgi:hypothetical protein